MTPTSSPRRDRVAAHIAVSGVSKTFPDRRVLTDISFTVHSSERVCIVGENGSGKTTLLRILFGLDDDHLGTATAPAPVGLYHQQPPFPLTWTVEQIVLDATRTQRNALEAVAAAAQQLAVSGSDGDAAAYGQALEEAERTDAWTVDTSVEQIMDGLGLAEIEPDRPASAMSGGQLARLSLAWLLLSRPFTLLLDEPTNHLDDRGAALLVSTLRSWRGPVLVASHDRALLDAIATRIIDLDPAPGMQRNAPRDDASGAGVGVTAYTGSYSDYLAARARVRERWEKRHRDEQKELRRLREAVRDSASVGHSSAKPRTESRIAKKFYGDRNAKVVSRRLRDAERNLERLEENQVRKPPVPLAFRGMMAAAERRQKQNGPAPIDAADDDAVVLRGIGLAVRGRLAPTDVIVPPSGRLLITGDNGTGKSTLLKVIAGAITEHEGTLVRRRGLSIAILQQEVGAVLLRAAGGDDPRAEPVESLYRRAVGEEAAAETPLSTFGLVAGHDVSRPVGNLSTGGQRRLEVAIILAEPPDVLLLDEPTNHFSLHLAEELERSIPSYPGAVIVASHDRLLRERWEGHRLDLHRAHGAW